MKTADPNAKKPAAAGTVPAVAPGYSAGQADTIRAAVPLPTRSVAVLLTRYYPYTECPHEAYNRGYFQTGGFLFVVHATKPGRNWEISVARVLSNEETEALWKRGISGVGTRLFARASLPHWATRPVAFRALNALFRSLLEAAAFLPDTLRDGPGEAVSKAAEAAAIACVGPKPAPKPKRRRRAWRDFL